MQRERSRTGAPPSVVYRERAERFDREAAAEQRAVRRYGRLRLALFTATVAGAWWLFAAGRSSPAWLFLAAAAALFVVFVARQRAARRRLRCAELMAGFNREGIARIARSWPDLRPWPDTPSLPGPAQPRDHDYANDLDLYGSASLLHLIAVCGTSPGWRTLQAWLLEAADPDTVARRQEAVAEMAGALDFRDGLAAEGRLVGDGGSGAQSFLRWAEGTPWLPGHTWLRAASYLLPPVNVAVIVLCSVGAAPMSALLWPLILSTVVVAMRWREIHGVFDEADDGASGLRRYGPLLGHLGPATLNSRYATDIRERIGGELPAGDGARSGPAGTRAGNTARAAPDEIAALRRLLDMVDARRSVLFHIPAAVILHWDVHVLAALERWKARSGRRVRGWLDAVGEAEALASLAALAADNPDWTMPVLDSGVTTLRARAIGHPLLAPDTCVRNDVEIGPAGSFLLVTGSNMSGKSTLLRAAGLNVVLAQAGGPVCAAELRLPPLRVMTSIRIEDSLAEGISYFMAGLQRLKRVVDAARTRRPPSRSAIESPTDPPHRDTPRTLYLLDEILQGTNSAERRIAARSVLRKLIGTRAIGAVTTHDLSLADADDLNDRAVPVHFTESVEEDAGELIFDYRLRDGIATSTNALMLLQIAGLGDAHGPGNP